MFRGARPITLLHIVTSKGFEGGAFQDSTYLSTLDPGGEPFHCIGRIIGDLERTEKVEIVPTNVKKGGLFYKPLTSGILLISISLEGFIVWIPILNFQISNVRAGILYNP